MGRRGNQHKYGVANGLESPRAKTEPVKITWLRCRICSHVFPSYHYVAHILEGHPERLPEIIAKLEANKPKIVGGQNG